MGLLFEDARPVAVGLAAMVWEPVRTYTTLVRHVRAGAHTARMLAVAPGSPLIAVRSVVLGSASGTWYAHVRQWLPTNRIPGGMRDRLALWDVGVNVDGLLAPYRPCHQVLWRGSTTMPNFGASGTASGRVRRFARTRLTLLPPVGVGPIAYNAETIITSPRLAAGQQPRGASDATPGGSDAPTREFVRR